MKLFGLCLIFLSILLVGCQEIMYERTILVDNNTGDYAFTLENKEVQEGKVIYYDLQLKLTYVPDDKINVFNVTHERTSAYLKTPSNEVTEIVEMIRVDRTDQYKEAQKVIIFRKLVPEVGVFNLSFAKEAGKYQVTDAQVTLLRYVFSDES